MDASFSFTLLVMKFLCFVLLIAGATCFHVDNEDKMFGKIVGGSYSSIKDAPYQAQVLQLGNGICGAAIISEYWLLSAAHCFEQTYGMSVSTGSSSRYGGGQRHQIEKVIVHRHYDVFTNDNDIALIKLVKPIKFNENQNAIPISTTPPNTGDVMTISGYGLEGNNRKASPILKIARVPVVNHKSCARKYMHDPITANMFCAGVGYVDACQGDSGGPGVIKGKLAGIVSSGMDCASVYYPGIYTRVDKYAKWIAAYVNNKNDKPARG